MNKYQEALDSLKCRVTTNSIICEMNQHRKDEICLACNEIKAIETLDELVERATPKKPNHKKFLGTVVRTPEGESPYSYNVIYGKCSVCGRTISSVDNYCPECGHRIDWSEDDD